MLWKLSHLSLELPPEWSSAAEEVFPLSADYQETGSRFFRLIISPHPLSGEPFGENVLFEDKKEGQWKIDWGNGKIFCYLNPGVHLPYCLSSLLVKIIKNSAGNSGLYLCHSACVIKNNQAWLIPGKEGRGKSTLARLLNLPLLNEDLTLVAVHQNHFYAYRVPDPQTLHESRPFFWEGPVPIKKIILIRREFPEGLYLLSPEEALRFILEEKCLLNHQGDEREILGKWGTLCETCMIAYTPEKPEWIRKLLDKD